MAILDHRPRPVLIVDDDMETLQAERALLADNGFRVIEARDGGEPLRVVQADAAVVVERPTEQLAEHRDKPCWIDIPDRTSGELARVAKDLNLHPLAVEDATQRDERPKIDQYENHYFIVFYAIESPSPGVVRYHEFSIFVVPNAIVTVHDGDCEGRKQVEKRFREGRLQTTGLLLHALLDTMVDAYFPIVDHFGERI